MHTPEKPENRAFLENLRIRSTVNDNEFLSHVIMNFEPPVALCHQHFKGYATLEMPLFGNQCCSRQALHSLEIILILAQFFVPTWLKYSFLFTRSTEL